MNWSLENVRAGRGNASSLASFLAWGVIHGLLSLLRALSQVVFIANPVAGLCVLAGLVASSLPLALYSVLAATASLAMASVTDTAGSIAFGLPGYDAVLAGGALATFILPYDENFLLTRPPDVSALFLVSILAAACVIGPLTAIIHAAMAKICSRSMSMPALTISFNIAAVIMILFYTSLQQLDDTPLPPSPTPTTPTLPVQRGLGSDISDIVAASFKGVGQIYFADATLSGVLILLGVAIASPISALALYIGSWIGLIVGGLAGGPQDALLDGLWSYNGSLAAACVVTFYVPTLSSALLAVLAAALATFIHVAVAAVFSTWGLPGPFTVPFCLAGWLVLAIHESPSFLFAKDVRTAAAQLGEDAAFVSPEVHWAMAQKVTKRKVEETSSVVGALGLLHPSRLAHATRQSPRLPAGKEDRLASQTGFTGVEIRAHYSDFTSAFPTTYITRESLADMITKAYGTTAAKTMSSRIFSVFDVDGDGVITFEEYITTLSLLHHGNDRGAKVWAFWLMDQDGDGYVGEDDVTRILDLLSSLAPSFSLHLGTDVDRLVAYIRRLPSGLLSLKGFLDHFHP